MTGTNSSVMNVATLTLQVRLKISDKMTAFYYHELINFTIHADLFFLILWIFPILIIFRGKIQRTSLQLKKYSSF